MRMPPQAAQIGMRTSMQMRMPPQARAEMPTEAQPEPKNADRVARTIADENPT